jgi:hypothetical protein
MHEHTQMVEEVYQALQKVGRSATPTIAGFGPRGPEATAENCSELELTSPSGRGYTLSIIEKE